MKRSIFLIPFAALVACADASSDLATDIADSALGARPITDEATFVSLVGDRQVLLKDTDNEIVIGSDGSISGVFNGAVLAGTWEWRDGAWCRTLTAGPRGPSPEDCQIWTITPEGEFEITRNRGEGSSFTYVLAG